jgi:ABC-type transport system involved in cytochrome c biogenesis permease subunit
VTAYLGAVAFVIAGATGAMYLIANRRLRRKVRTGGPNFGSLERLEHITFMAVTTGFALLTIGMITGLARVQHEGNGRLGPHWFTSPKVLLATAVWIVYALILHSPINPSFRGRKTALLSILGLVLMFGTIVAVQLMPAATGGAH